MKTRRFITRNRNQEGLIYLWTVKNIRDFFLEDGVWNHKSEDAYRSVIGTTEQFERLFIRSAPQKGSLFVIDQLSIVVNHKRWGKII